MSDVKSCFHCCRFYVCDDRNNEAIKIINGKNKREIIDAKFALLAKNCSRFVDSAENDCFDINLEGKNNGQKRRK